MPNAHTSHATLEISLPTLPIMDQTIKGIALSLRPIEVIAITLPFEDSVLPPGPCYSRAQLNPMHLIIYLNNSISNPKFWHMEKYSDKALHMCWCPSHNSVSYRISAGHIFWAFP